MNALPSHNKNIWIYPLIVLIVHAIATYTGLYFTYTWFDSPMHLAGGAAIGISAFYFLKYYIPDLTAWILVILIISLAGLAAVGWEFFEFALDYKFHSQHQPGLIDTMKDLYFGLVGASISAFMLIKKSRKPTVK